MQEVYLWLLWADAKYQCRHPILLENLRGTCIVFDFFPLEANLASLTEERTYSWRRNSETRKENSEPEVELL